jgi:hypothetical protein
MFEFSTPHPALSRGSEPKALSPGRGRGEGVLVKARVETRANLLAKQHQFIVGKGTAEPTLDV